MVIVDCLITDVVIGIVHNNCERSLRTSVSTLCTIENMLTIIVNFSMVLRALIVEYFLGCPL